MRAIIKLGCVCKVNKIFAKLFNGKVSTDIIYEFHNVNYVNKIHMTLFKIVFVKLLN